MESPINALTICQPYATLIARGIKRVENRKWAAHDEAIGQPLAIHAGQSRKWLDLDESGLIDLESEIPISEMPFGAVVATCILVACIPIHRCTVDNPLVKNRFPWLPTHEHASGPWCWILEDVEPLAAPLPWAGLLGLWTLPDDALEGAVAHG